MCERYYDRHCVFVLLLARASRPPFQERDVHIVDFHNEKATLVRSSKEGPTEANEEEQILKNDKLPQASGGPIQERLDERALRLELDAKFGDDADRHRGGAAV